MRPPAYNRFLRNLNGKLYAWVLTRSLEVLSENKALKVINRRIIDQGLKDTVGEVNLMSFNLPLGNAFLKRIPDISFYEI